MKSGVESTRRHFSARYTDHVMSATVRVFLLSTLFLLFAPSAFSQVVIYRFDFKKEGQSINYGFYDSAYVVAEATGGPAQWILTFREGPHKRYITVEDFGSFFSPRDRGDAKGVISAAAATGTPQTTFLAIGEPETYVRGANVKVEVPKKMSGYALSADDESAVPFDDDEGTVGYAGISSMNGTLQTSQTDSANHDAQTVEEAFADLIAYVERRGYLEFELIEPEPEPEPFDGGGGGGG